MDEARLKRAARSAFRAAARPSTTRSRSCGSCRSPISASPMVDHHRALRQGVPEVILGEGKTAEQIVGDRARARAHGAERARHAHRRRRRRRALVARACPAFSTTRRRARARSSSRRSARCSAREGRARERGDERHAASPRSAPRRCACSASRSSASSTSASPGIHRLLHKRPMLEEAGGHHRRSPGWRARSRASSAGSSTCPVIAVPTSIGYGAASAGDDGAVRDAHELRVGDHRGEHRQRVRRGVCGGADPATRQKARGAKKKAAKGRRRDTHGARARARSRHDHDTSTASRARRTSTTTSTDTTTSTTTSTSTRTRTSTGTRARARRARLLREGPGRGRSSSSTRRQRARRGHDHRGARRSRRARGA